jgi:starch synthase (maltosyl-transferring)
VSGLGGTNPQTDRPLSGTALFDAPRIALEAVTPSVDNGRFPARGLVGHDIEIGVDIICDGHDVLAGVVLWRTAASTEWTETRLALQGNDRWTAYIPITQMGLHYFTVEAWLDVYASICLQMTKKHAAGQSVALELQEATDLVREASERSGALALHELLVRLSHADEAEQRDLLTDDGTARLMQQYDPRAFRVRHTPELVIDAERQAASFASWYEIFPRSQSPDGDRHGTFTDVIARLPAVRDMGFDVLYLPPIHPIGRTNRKGRNNTLVAGPDDPGSPYAIGGAEGGHDAVHPELGTLEEFRALCAAALEHGLEIALDFAIQCSPDHPWLREHPEWFNWRPDGSIQYAENPPKRYEDIVNVAFYAKGAVPSLWIALRDVVQFWVTQGVRIFRVDNPHTKPLPFWEWMIADIRSRDPGVIFLSEAFTRPKMMYRLAKIGFTQSYTYFTWRNTAREMREYMVELTTQPPKDFFRPNFFVNTPDINPIFLHDSGRPGFLLRAALAATLSGLWGVYNGFEVCDSKALHGREEYLDSEKYQLRKWDLAQPGNIVDEITKLNRIRRENPALQSHLGIRFVETDNPHVLCYVKTSPDQSNAVLVAVSFDPHGVQDCTIDIWPALFGLPEGTQMVMQDLMLDQTTIFELGLNRLSLDPNFMPFAIWRARRSESP